MLNFSIDISDTVSEFSLQKQEVDSLSNYLLDRITDEYVAKWENIINTNLNSTRDEYRRGIYTDRPDDYTSIIGLTARDSKLALMIETGATTFDMKEGFMKSSKKTMKADGGWYLTIPFRHATSESIMDLQVPGTNTSVIDFMKTGETLGANDLPAPYDEIKTHEIKLNTGSLLTYKHKAPIYEGMHRRDISSTDKEKRGGYFTFRRVSDNSDLDAFMHPGFEPHNFMDKAMEETQFADVIDNAVQDWLDLKLG